MATSKTTTESKEKVEKKPATKDAGKTFIPKGKYHYALGRRKTSTARVRLYPKGSGMIEINSKSLKDFAQTNTIKNVIERALTQAGALKDMDVTVRVLGGGFKSQAEAISLGISRALLLHDENLRGALKPLGLLKRDPRKKERKKPGLKRARRAPQWAKR